MMRLIFKALVVVVLAVGLGNYVVYLNTGKLPLSDLKSKLSLSSLDFSPTQVFENTKRATTDAVGEHFSSKSETSATKIYKWTDEDGVTHYGERPVGANAQALDVNDGNVTILSIDDSAKAELEEAPPVPGEPQTPLEKARAAAEAMQKHHDVQASY